MAYKLIAQSNIYSNLDANYQLEIYEDTADIVTVQTLRIIGGIKLRRGSSSPSDKFMYITPTQVDFSILDSNRWLLGRMQGKPERTFQGILKKNGALYFKGTLISLLSSYDFSQPKTTIPMKLYCGLSRLKQSSALKSLGDGILKLSEMFRIALNSLELDLQMRVYMQTTPVPHMVMIDPEAVEFAYSYFIHNAGARVRDMITDENTNCYTLLESICKTFNLCLYEEEGGTWVIRQGLVDITSYIAVDKDTGNAGSFNANMTRNMSLDDLQISPNSFTVPAITKVSYRADMRNTADCFIEAAGSIGWKNKDFNDAQGWTVQAGGAKILNGTAIVPPGAAISQTSTGKVSSGKNVKIKVQGNLIRFYKFTDPLELHTTVFRVTLLGDDGSTYYLKQDLTWTTVPAYFAYNHYRYNKVEPTTNTINNNTYYSLRINEDLTAFMSNGLPTGRIKVELFGGNNYYNNYPMDTTQYSLCSIEVDPTALPADPDMPQALIVSAEYLPTKEKVIDVPLHDEDAFTNINLWNTLSGEKTRTWEPANKALLEMMAEETLKLNAYDMEGLDVKLMPGKAIEFKDWVYGNFTGTSKHYIPVYLERELIKGNTRVVMIEQEKKAVTISTTKEYSY
jgi:hypothetical protein